MTNAQAWALAQRPAGTPKSTDFQLIDVTLPELQAGDILVENSWMSVDPYMRGRMNDTRSYVPPFAIGEPMQGGAVGTVVESKSDKVATGTLVRSMNGWQSHFVAADNTVEVLDSSTGIPEQAFLGIVGMPGLTAYAGTLEICKPEAGQTIFVSGAAGAVGSAVGQIAKIKGARVIGSVGSDEKADYIKSLGFDAAINYKTCGDLTKALLNAAPEGIDMYFDNVGGSHLEAALHAAKPNARMALCGMISQYNNAEPAPGPNNLILMVGKSITAQGFIVSNYANLGPDFAKDMGSWIQSGQIKWDETVFEGLSSAPEAFMSLFSGGNTGKALVKIT